MAMMATTQPAGPRLRESQDTCQTHCRCLALSDPRLQDATGEDLAWVTCVSDRKRHGAGQLLWTGRGCACIKGSILEAESLCTHFPSTLLLLTASCMARSGGSFHGGPSCWDLSPVDTCRGSEDAGVPWTKLATVSRLQS